MKKYQKKYHRFVRNDKHPVGNTKPLSQIIVEINKKYDNNIEFYKTSYRLFNEGKYLSPGIDWTRTTLEEALKHNEVGRRRAIGRTTANYMHRTNTKDNQTYYNTSTKSYGSGGWSKRIRVPSLKRNNRVWRNFYTLFPSLKGKETYNGLKLKQID